MKTSLKEYVDSLALTDEERATLAPVLANEKVRTAIDRELSGAQSEISRKFDEAATAQRKSQEYYDTLQTYRSDVDKMLKDANKQVEDGKVLTTRMQERLKAKVAEGTLEQNEFDDILAASERNADPPRREPTTVNPATGDFVGREDFSRFEANVLNYVPAMMSIGAKHQELFGKPAPADVIATLPMKAAEAKKPLLQFAAETFKFSERETELAEARQKEHDETVRREERQKVISEMSNPTSRPQTGPANSPVLKFSTPEKAVVDSQNHRSRGVHAAIEAFRNHTYAKDGAQTA